MNRHDDAPRYTDADILAFVRAKREQIVDSFVQEIAEHELLAALEACPHLTPCETPSECDRRHLDCTCTHPHDDARECLPWLREHSDGSE